MDDPVDEGIFRQFEQTKGAAPGWVRRMPKGLRQSLVRIYWLRNDLRDFWAEAIGWAPSHHVRLFLYRLLGVRIGKKTSIHRGCRFYAPRGVTIGDHSVINRQVLLDGRSGLEVGQNVSISEGAMILTLEHDPNSPEFAARGGKVTIQDYCFVGARAIVLPGVTMGCGSGAAAGAVGTRDIPEYQIVGGVPARQIGQRSRDLRYSLNYRKFLG
jgi:acetyltransferase-like isoleucine patch superfamily enzyme